MEKILLRQNSLRRWFGAFDIFKKAGWIIPFTEENKNEDKNVFEATGIDKDGNLSSEKKIIIKTEDCQNPEALMKAHGFDPRLYKLISARNSVWGRAKEDGKTQYSSRISVKPLSEEKEITFADIDNFFEKVNYLNIPAVEPCLNTTSSDDFLEIDLQDLHIGLYSYGAETGEDYDGYIAIENFEKALSDVITRCEGHSFKRIVFSLLGDILHVNNEQNTTLKGTRQDVDTRVTKMFDMALTMLIASVESLEKIAPVEIINVAGNHDATLNYMLCKSLEMAFRNHERVQFFNTPSPRKYREYGNILLGWCHGDMPPKNITEWMQSEAAPAWGRTVFREVHCGHLHSLSTIQKIEEEQSGLIVRHLPALCASSAWENYQGYGRNPKTLISFVWNEQQGLRDIWYSNI